MYTCISTINIQGKFVSSSTPTHMLLSKFSHCAASCRLRRIRMLSMGKSTKRRPQGDSNTHMHTEPATSCRSCCCIWGLLHLGASTRRHKVVATQSLAHAAHWATGGTTTHSCCSSCCSCAGGFLHVGHVHKDTGPSVAATHPRTQGSQNVCLQGSCTTRRSRSFPRTFTGSVKPYVHIGQSSSPWGIAVALTSGHLAGSRPSGKASRKSPVRGLIGRSRSRLRDRCC